MLLQVEQLSVSYGLAQVLRDVSLAVDYAEIVALVGANGAGKTTFLRTLSGLISPERGQILLDGHSITSVPANVRPGLGICHVPEGRQVFSGMTIRENLMIGAYSRSDRLAIAEDYERVLALFPELVDKQQRQAGTLSGGEQQMVAIGRGLMGKPRLLLIDELSLGLAPTIVDRLIDLIRNIHQELRIGILFVEQDVRLALELANRGYILENGTISLKGPSIELLGNPMIRAAYLGL